MDGKESIRIAHLIGSTGIYGAERWILAQLRYMGRHRAHASLINLVDQPGKSSAIVSEAQKLGYDAADFYTGGRFNPFGVLRLARMLRQREFSVLHSHGYKSDVMGLLAGKLARTKLVSTPHGWSHEKDKKLALYERLGRVCLKLFDRICPLSPSLYKDLCTSGIKTSQMRLILNGVDIREIDAAPAKAKLNGKKRIGYIGQFIERKNLDNLIEAFVRLGRHDCELLLIGDGPSRQKLVRYIETINGRSAVHCPGYTTKRLEDLKGLDVFVLPSLLEGIPRCIMEAHAAMVPVVATDIDGIRALVKPGETGLLVSPGDPDALAAAINHVLNSPELARKLALAGRKLIEERFSAARMARQYETLYLSLSNLA